MIDQKKIKIGFIGAGSIGSLFGGYLARIQSEKFSIEIIFFCREEQTQKINTDGLAIYLKDSTYIVNNIKAYRNPDDYRKDQNRKHIGFDFMFLAIKAYDLESVVLEYSALLKRSNWLVILQNGIGNEEIIKKYCNNCKLIRIITSHGALLKKPGHVYHTGRGFTFIGFPSLYLHNLTEEVFTDAKSNLNLLKLILDLAGIEVSISEDIDEKIWEKAFVNIGINALGALTRLRNGKILENEGLKKLMSETVKEALKVAELKEIKLSTDNFVELTYSVANETYNNKNSMLQDILKGKRTEIEFLNGKIVEYAKELGVDVPINEFLTILVKGLEAS